MTTFWYARDTRMLALEAIEQLKVVRDADGDIVGATVYTRRGEQLRMEQADAMRLVRALKGGVPA